MDYNLSDNDHLFWRVRMDHGTQATYADPINNAFSAASYQPSYDGQGQWTHVFSPNATNNFVYAVATIGQSLPRTKMLLMRQHSRPGYIWLQ